jgi:hypothetical protein
MGQKVNPISLRLQQTNREFDNCWYSDYFYRKLVSRDIYLQQYINSFLKLVKCPSARFSIQYSTKNIQLSSFLCYPKQSRELRSRIFGITFPRKRKTKLKSKLGLFLLDKKKPSKKNKETSRVSRRQKTLKFLIDNRLWSSSFFPFSSFFLQSKKNKDLSSLILLMKNKDQKKKTGLKDTRQLISLNILSNTIQRSIYTNQNISCFKNSRNKPGHFFLPFLSQEFFSKTENSKKPLVSLLPYFSSLPTKNETVNSVYLSYKKQSDIGSNKIKKNSNLLFFIKNLITTLFFRKFLRFNSSFFLQSKKEHYFSKKSLYSSSFLQCKKDQKSQEYTNSLIFHREYRKNFLKFFLVFSLLYTEYNKNIGDNSKSFFRVSTKQYSNREKLVNSIYSFSTFQSISIFLSTIQNKTPINFLLQKSVDSFFNLYLKNNSNSRTMNFLQNKKLWNKNEFNGLLHSKKQQKDLLTLSKVQSLLSFTSYENRWNLFHILKKDQMQELKYKNYLQYFLGSQFHINTEFLPFNVSQDWQSAGFLADEIVYFLERRVTFRRLKHKILKKITENSNIRGVRISCSGRVGGKSKKAQRAKTDCVKYGQTSRHTFSSPIDFAARTARTIFGSVGIKVWICFN